MVGNSKELKQQKNYDNFQTSSTNISKDNLKIKSKKSNIPD